MKPDYEAMSVEDLEAAIHLLGEKRAEIADEQRAVHSVLDRKLTEQAAARKLGMMSDREKAALRQALDALSIESEERVGNPGQ